VLIFTDDDHKIQEHYYHRSFANCNIAYLSECLLTKNVSIIFFVAFT
jgi:hypothetical protein